MTTRSNINVVYLKRIEKRGEKLILYVNVEHKKLLSKQNNSTKSQ